MNFEPQKFFIGLMDFFSIWLPGALLVYLLKDQIGLVALGRELPLVGVEGGVVFLFASYLAGHFIFLLGSMLDDWLYEPLRDGTRDRQIDRLADGKRLSGWFVRAFAAHSFPKDDKALRQALRLRDEQLGAAGASSAVNAFQWSKAKLALEHPQVLAQVERFEADSKFFRSLCAILILLPIWEAVKLGASLFNPEGSIAIFAPTTLWRFAGLFLIAALGFLLALWRYAERRAKATSQAYWFVLAASSPAQPGQGRQSKTTGLPTHAGGIVLRRFSNGVVKYLRVPAKGKPGQRVLPKGHIEADEAPERTAVREVLEEAGIWGRVEEQLADDVEFRKGRKQIRVRFFVMEFLKAEKRKPPREHGWLPAREPGDKDPRPPSWRPLGSFDDLPPESQKAVVAAALFLNGKAEITPARAPPPPSPRSSRRR